MPSGGARPGAGRPKKGEEKNVQRQLTTAEIYALLDSPHVAYISRKTILYTTAFKEQAWQRFSDGIDMVRIFEDAGLNVEVFGKDRIDSFFEQLRDQKVKGVPFNDGSEWHDNPPHSKFHFPSSPSFPKYASPQAIARMAHEISYLKQEVEFIKKIILAGREGK